MKLLLGLILGLAISSLANSWSNFLPQYFQQTFPKIQTVFTEGPVYWTSMQISDSINFHVIADRGEILHSRYTPHRTGSIYMRFGDSSLDQSRPIPGQEVHLLDNPVHFDLPIEYDSLLYAGRFSAFLNEILRKNHEIWNITNTSVSPNDSVLDFHNVSGVQNKVILPKFYTQEQTQDIQKRIQTASAIITQYPWIHRSSVEGILLQSNEQIINSDPSKIHRFRRSLIYSFSLEHFSADGIPLQSYESIYYPSFAEFPSSDSLQKILVSYISQMDSLRKLPAAQPYAGPVLLSSRAAAVFIHEILGHRTESHRFRESMDGQTLMHKIDSRITHPDISIEDNPLLKSYNEQPLLGHYLFDEEGVPAQKANLVQNGILKGFLHSRSTPHRKFRSNGHGRATPGHKPVARMGNTILTSKNGLDSASLIQMLRSEAQKQDLEFAYVIENLYGGHTFTDRSLPQSFKLSPFLLRKVYADSSRADEWVRGLDASGTPLVSFSQIIATGKEPTVFNGYCGAESGWVPVSAVSPALLIQNMELESQFKTSVKLPILSDPGASR